MSQAPFGSTSRHGLTITLIVLGVLTVLAFLLHVGIGAYFRLSPIQVAQEVLRGDVGGSDAINNVIWRLRLPRAAACVLVGMMLGLVGSAFQSLFRNPLADPYLVGASSGAAVGGAIATVAGWSALFNGLAVGLAALIGGLATLAVVIAIASRRGRQEVTTLLLSGVVVGSMLAALLALVLLSAGQDTNRVLRWLMGSMTPMFAPKLWVLLAALVIGAPILLRDAKALNLMALGEETARRLGVDAHRVKWRVLIVGTAMTSIAVGAVGIIGFLGLVSPHIARRLVGVDWRRSLPVSALVGAVLLCLADLAAQRLVPDVELPVGAVTAILGAPALLVLIRRKD
ncbi:MAG: FecCD family ABC transporter permease [Fimbriimonadaceae bacterium]